MEDLIKRSDAAEVIYKALKTPPLKGVLTDTMSLAIALARDIPSADRPQGEWIFKEMTDDYHIIGRCSICKERRRIDNYCPNCGADMRKGADDE